MSTNIYLHTANLTTSVVSKVQVLLGIRLVRNSLYLLRRSRYIRHTVPSNQVFLPSLTKTSIMSSRPQELLATVNSTARRILYEQVDVKASIISMDKKLLSALEDDDDNDDDDDDDDDDDGAGGAAANTVDKEELF